ncbi:hypothetical protein [Klebsiella pneumoniae]
MASGTELRLYRMAAAPYPAYNPKSPLAQGLLKLPVLYGRCLGPTRSLQG